MCAAFSLSLSDAFEAREYTNTEEKEREREREHVLCDNTEQLSLITHVKNIFFCSLVLLGGKFASEIFKLVLKRYAIKTHVKHTHRAYARGKEEERDLRA